MSKVLRVAKEERAKERAMVQVVAKELVPLNPLTAVVARTLTLVKRGQAVSCLLVDIVRSRSISQLIIISDTVETSLPTGNMFREKEIRISDHYPIQNPISLLPSVRKVCL